MSAVVVVSMMWTTTELVALHTGDAACPHCCSGSSDNIGGRSFAERLCAPPIDVVYTWVNGSDPLWLAQLSAYKRMYGLEADPTADADGSVGAFNASNATAEVQGESGSGSESEDGAGDAAASANRYRDSNELLYSLRSLEKYAPWIRHIHIVTCGQVPSWLDVSHPRISIVTHEEIFPNRSHLPVFSSPAIETHLHRVPGLTQKFIYFNDDVFLASDVWPDDFITSRGQRVYLSWEVPKCNPGCIETWIGDGFCDMACNSSACAWDAGDCANSTRPTTTPGGTTGGTKAVSSYCATGCPNSWIGDKTCDKRCERVECGFDGTDCGKDVLNREVPTVVPQSWGTTETFDAAKPSLHIDMKDLLVAITDGESNEVYDLEVEHAELDESEGVRFSVFSSHFNSLVVLLDTDKMPTEATAQHKERCEGASATVNEGYDCTATEVMVVPAYFTLKRNGTNIGEHSFTIRFVRIPPPQNTTHTTSNSSSTNPVAEGSTGDASIPASGGDAGSGATAAAAASSSTGGERRRRLAGHSRQRSAVKLTTRELLADETGRWVPTSSVVDQLEAAEALAAKDAARKERWLSERPDVAAALREAWEQAVAAAGLLAGRGFRLKENGAIVPAEGLGVGEAVHTDGAQPTRLRGGARRLLLDTYGSSLIHTNRLIASQFGRSQRKAPAHMPHFIDRGFVQSLEERFPKEWDATSSHRFRDPEDIQYAFAYFYWVMEGGAQSGLDMSTYWRRELDTDLDGRLNVNELRTLAAVVHGRSPTDEEIADLQYCLAPPEQRTVTRETSSGTVTSTEVVTPHITLERLMACDIATKGLSEHARFEGTHTEESLNEVAFEMITDNFNQTRDQLDSIRARKTKFVCVNDDMGDAPKALQDMLQDFYLSFFPYPSQFELPPGERNPYLYIEPLQAHLMFRRALSTGLWVVGVGIVAAALAMFVTKAVRADAGAGPARHQPAGASRSTVPHVGGEEGKGIAGGAAVSPGGRDGASGVASPPSSSKRRKRGRGGRKRVSSGQED